MQLELKSFADAGVLDKERLIIRVLADVNIGSYVVLRSKKNDNGMPISGTKDAYWFPDVKVSRGDLIVLYTKRKSARWLSIRKISVFFSRPLTILLLRITKLSV